MGRIDTPFQVGMNSSHRARSWLAPVVGSIMLLGRRCAVRVTANTRTRYNHPGLTTLAANISWPASDWTSASGAVVRLTHRGSASTHLCSLSSGSLSCRYAPSTRIRFALRG